MWFKLMWNFNVQNKLALTNINGKLWTLHPRPKLPDQEADCYKEAEESEADKEGDIALVLDKSSGIIQPFNRKLLLGHDK